MYNIEDIRKSFPILSKKINDKPLVYLDNASSAQKPKMVIDAVRKMYEEEYSNVHRGLHILSNLATDKYEAVRAKIQHFLNAKYEDEIIFNSGTTHGINMVSYGWGVPNLSAGDEIILSVIEHHANIVPWHFLRERHGVVLKWVKPDDDGHLDVQKVIDSITPKTKLIAMTQMSNVLGCVVDIKTVCAHARSRDIRVLVDGSQSCVHMAVDVQDLNCDFFALTGHKLYGPSASGAIYIRRDIATEMQPFIGGGDMIRTVGYDDIIYNTPPHKFEAGTPAIVQMIGLGAALDFLEKVGMDNIAQHESHLKNYAMDKLSNLTGVNIQGTTLNKGAIFSFTIDGIGHPHDISTILDQRGIAIRAGHHCAQPLMKHLNVSATARASFGMYNTIEEVDKLIDAIKFCQKLLA